MIVVVEDEKELCESLKMLLTEKGYEIVPEAAMKRINILAIHRLICFC